MSSWHRGPYRSRFLFFPWGSLPLSLVPGILSANLQGPLGFCDLSARLGSYVHPSNSANERLEFAQVQALQGLLSVNVRLVKEIVHTLNQLIAQSHSPQYRHCVYSRRVAGI